MHASARKYTASSPVLFADRISINFDEPPFRWKPQHFSALSTLRPAAQLIFFFFFFLPGNERPLFFRREIIRYPEEQKRTVEGKGKREHRRERESRTDDNQSIVCQNRRQRYN